MTSPTASPARRAPIARAAGVLVALLAILAVAPARAAAQSAPRPQSHPHAGHHPAADDSSFAALQRRGKTAMGVDQYRSAHRFDDLVDGGQIELRSTVDDPAAERAIREHLETVARAFAAGDFTTPAFVHDKRDARQVPGTTTMAARRSAIRYDVKPLPGGAALRITTRDPAAIRAVHEFLAFQRADHRTVGRKM